LQHEAQLNHQNKMNITEPIQIITGTEIEVFLRIAAFLNPHLETPETAVGQQILADRSTAPNYHFHRAMRDALGDHDADLISYNGGRGACYAAWTPASESEDGLAHVAVLPRVKSAAPYFSTLPDVVALP
jgi:hypothetical protein